MTPGDSQLHELAAVVNKMTGNIRLGLLGISRSQESIESALVFPRYLRCILGLVGDTIQGGVRGNESRRLFAQGVATTVVIVLLLTL